MILIPSRTEIIYNININNWDEYLILNAEIQKGVFVNTADKPPRTTNHN